MSTVRLGSMGRWVTSLACLSAVVASSVMAWAQDPPAQSPYPPPQQPYPPPQQPYPPPQQQPYPPQQQQPYPQQQQQPYPQQQQPYPPQQQPYPPQQQPYPPQQQPYPPPLQQPYAPPYPPPYVPPLGTAPITNRYRSPGEMAFLYGVGIAYGLGSGVWIDAIGKIDDPGIAFIPPVALGAVVPIGLYFWDQSAKFDRGVPSSIGTGAILGGLEGMAISGLQWQLTGNGGPSSWGFPTWTTLTFLTATAGGIGGYAFGEWFQPDPRSLGFIASGAGWGAITGVLFGSGVVGGDWKDGAAVWGFLGYNAGILATGALSTVYVPSWETIKYMWAGEVLGTLATTPVYLFYIGSSADPRHGMIANAVGGLAGIGLAAALTANMTDRPGAASWMPPFQIAVGPTQSRGAQLTAYGQF